MTEELERMAEVSIIPHADGDLVSVVVREGGSLSIATMPAADAPGAVDPDACIACGGAGEQVIWVYGEPEPRETFTCLSCGGSGRRR